MDLRVDADARHLSADAEKAEDISIRYGDGHSRPMHSGGPTIAEYRQFRAECLTKLYENVAAVHHVPASEVRAALGTHRSKLFDFVVIASFACAYVLFARRFTRGIWRRFPPSSDVGWGILATLGTAPVIGTLGWALGGGWSWYLETLRIGYGHLVERSERIPWIQHGSVIFAIATLVYLAASYLSSRTARTAPPERASVLDLRK